MPLEPSVLLPDGTPFATWERPLEFSRTYFVDASSEAASDETIAAGPFGTIRRGAYSYSLNWAKPPAGQ